MCAQSKKRRGSFRAALPLIGVMLVIAAFPSVAAQAESQSLYLDGNGAPSASLSTTAPTSSSLANHDSQRNDDPGLTVQKGGKTSTESDPTKHQRWTGPSGGLTLDGPVSFTFWSAMKDFTVDKKGAVLAYLLDCTETGSDCEEIDFVTEISNPWNPSGSWTSKTLSFGNVDYTIAAGRVLVLKVVVRDNSDDDMWFAYDSAAYPSSLSLELAAAPPTTTTTLGPPPPTTTTTVTSTTTTTTTAPGPTPPTTTTIVAPITTTAIVAPVAPTTTTLPTVRTTTTTPPTTTTTTVAPDSTTTTSLPESITSTTTTPTEAEPETPDLDIAMAALPGDDDSANGVGSEPQTMSGALFEGLDVVIPPLAAAAILSPLMILEALVGAFVETGRELFIPSVLLLAASIWMFHDTRRDRTQAQSEPT
ncbi:MAG: hypothetical protein QNL12_09210 [Acidimicrobiia bacterium]|nr:hypothetical protein [Acidimicrobiia bacterium]